MALKVGSKVRIIATGETAFVHVIQRGKPYPFYVHTEEHPDEDAPLDPYARKEIEEID